MPNPKRRHSSSRQALRRTHDTLDRIELNRCAHCGAPVRSHRVCDNCGWYGFQKGADKRGTEVLERQEF